MSEDTPAVTVQKLLNGLGFGDADSSIAVTADDADLLTIIDQSVRLTQMIVPVGTDASNQPIDDDGCGDGRGCNTVFAGLGDERQVFKRSLDRPKVFGGGATMAAAMVVGRGDTPDTLGEVYLQAIANLNNADVDFGAHTDDHAAAPNSGCGAIDKFPVILAASVTYSNQIKNMISALGISMNNMTGVLKNFQLAAEKFGELPYSGSEISEMIQKEGKVVKELAGAHIEKAIVINTIENYTIDQSFIRRQTDGKADVFAVDVWRVQQLADRLYETPVDRHVALLSELVYTLATAAVLTRGNLPVYICTE